MPVGPEADFHRATRRPWELIQNGVWPCYSLVDFLPRPTIGNQSGICRATLLDREKTAGLKVERKMSRSFGYERKRKSGTTSLAPASSRTDARSRWAIPIQVIPADLAACT